MRNKGVEALQTVAGWIALVIMALAPWVGGAIALQVYQDTQAAVGPEVAPVLMPVKPVSTDDAQTVQVRASWGEVPQAYSPNWSGTVTEMGAHLLDGPIQEGQHLLKVDAIWRLAVITERPFFRMIGEGSSGDDVLMLNEMLARLGFSAGGSEDWSPWTALGVQELAASVGAPAGTAQFDPSWTVWIPTANFHVTAVHYAVGEAAPVQSSALLDGRPTANSVHISADGVDLIRDSPDEWVLEAAGGSFPYSGDPNRAVTNLIAVADFLPVSDQPIDGLLKFRNPVQGYQVPPSALISSGPEGYCIATADRGDSGPDTWSIVPARILGGKVGSSIIETDASVVYVLTNPADLELSAVSCR